MSAAKNGAQIPFSEAVKVKPTPGSTTVFTGHVPQDWRGHVSAHGGFLQSLIFSTARTYFSTFQPSRQQPDPITSHLQFLKFVEVGAVRLVVKPIQFGSRVSVIQVEIQRTRDGGVCVLAIVTQGNLAAERGLSLETVEVLRREEMPCRERDCEKFVYPENIAQLVPGVMKCDQWRIKGGIGGTFNSEMGRSIREMWYSFADGTGFDVLSLGYLTDLFVGAPSNYAPDSADYKAGIFLPTLSINTEIKRDPKGCKWLYVRVQAREIRNGRFDSDVIVANEEGEIIALSKHVSLVLSRNSPEELKRIFRL